MYSAYYRSNYCEWSHFQLAAIGWRSRGRYLIGKECHLASIDLKTFLGGSTFHDWSFVTLKGQIITVYFQYWMGLLKIELKFPSLYRSNFV